MQVLRIKSITRDSSGGLFIANERYMQVESTWLDKVCVSLYGSSDVYYLDMKTGNIYVYRAKLRNVVNGCVFLRDRDEYNQVYDAIANQRYHGMPENMFSRLDREWNESHK